MRRSDCQTVECTPQACLHVFMSLRAIATSRDGIVVLCLMLASPELLDHAVCKVDDESLQARLDSHLKVV